MKVRMFLFGNTRSSVELQHARWARRGRRLDFFGAAVLTGNPKLRSVGALCSVGLLGILPTQTCTVAGRLPSSVSLGHRGLDEVSM